IACGGSYITEIGVVLFSSTLGFGCLTFIVITYFRKGKKKASPVLLPHLTVSSTLLHTVLFAYLKPIYNTPPDLDFIIAIFYYIISLMMNPWYLCIPETHLQFFINIKSLDFFVLQYGITTHKPSDLQHKEP
ncbi:putative Olfactory receptor CHOR34 protein, partial [Naja naja]